MAVVVINISWQDARERVRLDLDALSVNLHSIFTEEYWVEHDKFVMYRPRVTYSRSQDGCHKVVLLYLGEDHPELIDDGIVWGQSTIIIDEKPLVALVSWDSLPKRRSTDGHAKCTIESEPDERATQRAVVSRIRREQQKFKTELLKRGARCAITGETLIDALEAAHIHDVGAGGLDTVENGIILRSDLHKLYDAGYFDIAVDGSIEVRHEVGDEYKKLLRGAKISGEILARIKCNLPKRAKRSPKAPDVE